MADKPSLWDAMKSWVAQTETGAWFQGVDIDRDMSLGPKEKDMRREYLNRMVEHGVLKRDKKKQGVFRRIVKECPKVNIEAACPGSYLPLIWPFGIQHIAKVFGGNVVIDAGEPNTGKTTFCVDFSVKNMYQMARVEGGIVIPGIKYFTCEASAEEFLELLGKYSDVPPEDFAKHVDVRKRKNTFADAIEPNAINIVDYLVVHEDFYRVGIEIDEIQDALGPKGIAVICLQKSPGQELGRGGLGTEELTRLYLSMEQKRDREHHRVPDVYTMRIIKAKHPMRKNLNPNGWYWEYRFQEGTELFERLKMPFGFPTDVGIDDPPLPPTDPRVIGSKSQSVMLNEEILEEPEPELEPRQEALIV